jgi:hypothetical protein
LTSQNPKNTSLLTYFLYLFIRPTYGIRRILEDKPSFQRIVVFLFYVGALRGIIELVWELLMAGQFSQTILTPALFKRQILSDGSLFLLGNITTAYVRWPIFALIPFLFTRFLGGRTNFQEFLRLYGIVLGLFVVTALPNFIYVFFKLPLIKFEVSYAYNPIFGIGQALTSLWLIFISSQILRITNKSSWIESISISLLIPLTNMGLLVLCSKIFFNFPVIVLLSQRKIFLIAAFCFIIATLAATPFLLWIGHKIDQKGRRNET